MKISLVYCDRLLFSYHYVLTFNTNAINLPAPSGSCSEFRTMQLQGPYVEAPSRNCNTTSIITMPSRYCTRLHWLPVQQRITYKLAVLTYRVRSTSTQAYLNDRMTERVCSPTLRSSAIQLLVQPLTRTDFSAFPGVLFDFQHRLSGTRCHKQFSSATLSVFKSGLETFLLLMLSLNTDTSCHKRLRSYDRIAL